MITLEQFSVIHMKMAMAMGNNEQELQICKEFGITKEEWETGKAHYYAKMADPADGGKTAAAMAQAAMNNLPNMTNPVAPVKQQAPAPGDFTANNVKIYLSEFDVQMVEFLTGQNHHVVLQHFPKEDPNDEFMANHVQGRAHISINEQSYNIYGGVAHIELSSKAVKFVFDAEGMERMKCSAVTVSFDITGKKYQQLKYMLGRMYREKLHITSETDPEIYTMNGTEYNLKWDTFNSGANTIHIRPNLANLPALHTYNMVVMPAFKKGIAPNEKELFAEMLEAFMANLESEVRSVIAFYMENDSQYQVYMYTQLDQGNFMKGINESLVYLPQLPLEFGGGEDAAWNNYNECMKDYQSNR